MTACPFIKKSGKKLLLKLNSDLYEKDLFARVKAEHPEALLSLKKSGNYYFVDMQVDRFEDYFDFLNYLIYLSRS